MEVLEISGENAEEFLPLLGPDITDDMKRVFYRGIGAKDDNDVPVGAIIFELIGSEGDEDTKSAIRFAVGKSDDINEAMQKSYKDDAVYDEDIAESFYEFTDETSADLCATGGFSKEKKESDIVRLTLEEVSKMEFAKKRKLPPHIDSISSLSVMQYRCAIKEFLFKGQKGSIEDLAYLPMTWFDGDVSTCSVSDGNVDGLFLVRATPSGVLAPVFFYACGPDYLKNLIFMLIKSIEKMLEKYPPETEVVVSRTKKASRELMAKLAPGLRGEEVFFGTRKE